MHVLLLGKEKDFGLSFCGVLEKSKRVKRYSFIQSMDWLERANQPTDKVVFLPHGSTELEVHPNHKNVFFVALTHKAEEEDQVNLPDFVMRVMSAPVLSVDIDKLAAFVQVSRSWNTVNKNPSFAQIRRLSDGDVLFEMDMLTACKDEFAKDLQDFIDGGNALENYRLFANRIKSKFQLLDLNTLFLATSFVEDTCSYGALKKQDQVVFKRLVQVVRNLHVSVGELLQAQSN